MTAPHGSITLPVSDAVAGTVPGNVRALENFMSAIIALHEGSVSVDWVRKVLEEKTTGVQDTMPAGQLSGLDRPASIDLLSDPVFFEELKNAASPKWSWLREAEEEHILAALRERSSEDGRARIFQMEQALKNRRSRQQGGEGDNPRRIHHYKLLFYLMIRDDHAGHMKEFQAIIGLGYAQTDSVVENLIKFRCLSKGGKDGPAQRYVLAEGM